ncbi:MAG: VWA domain-containing protein [Acidobacteria bacterium]|nr:VWA domain-containing protein [Acidobacteriota bacterium]
MSLRRQLLCLCLCVVAGLTTASFAQAPAPSVVIDVTAVAADGTPITSLKAVDLTLRIDGRPQPITDIRLIEHAEGPDTASPLPAPYATNQLVQGRTMAIAVDVTRVSASLASSVTEGVTALVGALTPRDRLALVVLAGDGFSTDFTTRHTLIQDAAATIKTGAPEGGDAKEREAAVVASLTLLNRLCTTLAVEPGYKTVVFLSSPFSPTSDSRRAIQLVAETVARQRIHLVVVDPSAATIARNGGLAALAAASGGVMMPTAGSTTNAFATIAARSESRYEVSFEPTSDHQNDRVHRVVVRSTRAGVQLSAPPAVFIGKPDPSAEPMVALTDMLGQTRAFRDLPLRAAVFPVRSDAPSEVRLMLLAETEDPARTLGWAEFALIAPSGSVVARWKADSADAALRPIMTAALAPEGSYRLRMAASEFSGRRGAVDVEFDARLGTAGPFKTSALMFGVLEQEAFMPMLRPAADATTVMGYIEIYGTPDAGETLDVQFEIAQSPDADPLLATPGTMRTTPASDRRAAVATLDLSTLSPGDYLVTAVIAVNGNTVGRVTRTLRRAVR